MIQEIKKLGKTESIRLVRDATGCDLSTASAAVMLGDNLSEAIMLALNPASVINNSHNIVMSIEVKGKPAAIGRALFKIAEELEHVTI